MEVELDKFEQAIEDDAENYVPVPAKKRAAIETIIDEARKSKNINIRISEYDLDKLKERSALEGLPYKRTPEQSSEVSFVL